MADHEASRRHGGARRVVSLLVIATSVMAGAALIALTVTLGSCSAFGGRCPADRPGIFEDDVMGGAAMGAFLMVGVPIFVWSPSVKRLIHGVMWGLAAGFLVGLMARSVAHG